LDIANTNTTVYDVDDDMPYNGYEDKPLKVPKMERPSPKSAKMGPASMKQGVKFDQEQFGPHVIKMGQYDEDMLDRVVSKYKKMGHSVQKENQIIKLNLIKATTCLQEEMIATYTDHMDHSDITLVSSAGQAIPCHRFVLAVRSPAFKAMFSQMEQVFQEVSVDASTEALKAMVKYMYTDCLDDADITEDLMKLAEKYELMQLKELCLPLFVKKIRVDNCLKAYIYGALHNYEPLKLEAFNMLDQNWKMYENSADLLEMMKTHPQVVMEILNRLHKKKSGFLVRASQVNLKMIKAFECMQESIIKAFNDEGKNNMPFTDMTLVSSTGQEVQCHRFILAMRSQEFKQMFANSSSTEEVKIHLDVSTEALETLVKYLYTDSVAHEDITEDLVALSEKYNLTQLKEWLMPTFIEKISVDNCLKMYVFGYKHKFESLKTSAFKTLDENWKYYENSSDFMDMMKNCPNAILEIMSRLQKVNECQPIVMDGVQPRLVDF